MASTATPPWSGFESYPHNIATLDPLDDDAAGYSQRLHSAEGRLFTPDALNLTVLDYPLPSDALLGFPATPALPPLEREIRTQAELEVVLAESTAALSARVIVIHPSRPRVVSRCKLAITATATRQLLSTYAVHPAFVDFLTAFGDKMVEVDELHGGAVVHGDQRAFAYKHVIEKGDTIYRWSIRNTAVWMGDAARVSILVQPSAGVVGRLRGLRGEVDVARVVISDAAAGWRPYFNVLDRFFLEETTAAVNKEVDGGGPESQHCGLKNPAEMLVVTFDTVQKLQKFEERVQTMMSTLALNAETLEILRDAAPTQAVDVARHIRNAEALLRKTSGRNRLMYNVLEYQHNDALASQGNMRTHFEMQAQSDRVKTGLLTQRTVRDAVGVKIMTYMALLYLPASFVAVCLALFRLFVSSSSRRMCV
ncbi:hypothetical protein EDC01DRAFT_333739 [Geopyxis carbonaria]|nr:hypothetical protein EDC01DRAFT_333739 [Geopyxis carbonaria]